MHIKGIRKIIISVNAAYIYLLYTIFCLPRIYLLAVYDKNLKVSQNFFFIVPVDIILYRVQY